MIFKVIDNHCGRLFYRQLGFLYFDCVIAYRFRDFFMFSRRSTRYCTKATYLL